MKNATKLRSSAKKANNQSGLSLLELSISITIISLLIAATLAGQNLKHRQELSQVVTDISTITSAVGQFKTTYGSYPGDFRTATTTFTGTTYNGDGNGYLATALGGTPTVMDQRNTDEEYIFWQHLALSGLLSSPTSGNYAGAPTGDGGVMKASLGYGLYQARKAINFPSSTTNPLGKMVIQVSKSGNEGLFSTKEAYDFDAKYDNTNPVGSTGTIAAADGTSDAGNCVASNAHNLAYTNATPCMLYFFIE